MAETNIISHKIKQNEILSRIIAQNYIGADGKAIDLKTQQGKLLSAKLSEALIGQADNKKVVIPNAKVPHSNHIMAGADLALVEELNLGDGLSFVRSDVANAKKAAAATTPPKAEPTPAPEAKVTVVPADPAVPPAPVAEVPKAENTCPDVEAPVKTAPAVADNPFSLPNLAAKEQAAPVESPVVPPAEVAPPAPEKVPSAPVAEATVPERDVTFVDSNTGARNTNEAAHLVEDRPAPEPQAPAAPVAEPESSKAAEPSKEVSAHPLTYNPGSFKASLASVDKKPEDVEIPQLGEPEKPEPLQSISGFLAKENFAEHEGEVSPDAIPKGEKPDSTRVAIDF